MSHVTLVETKPGEFEFRLPDIGEGVVEGEIVKWLVKEGDTVTEDQPVVEIMTDKATVEIPSPKSGTLVKRFWEEGQICPVGQGLILIATADGAPSQLAAAAPATMENPGAKAVVTPPPTPTPAPAPVAAPVALAKPSGAKALAAPATRKLARERGVDIQAIAGSGPHGRVTKDDVQGFQAGGTPAAAATPSQSPSPVAVKSAEGDERRPMRGLRRKIAEKITQAAFTIPHVTTFDEVDLTNLVALRARMKPKAEAVGVKLSYMPFFMKAIVAALRQFPVFNSSLDDTTNELVLKKSIHVGFAAATDNGLLVPVVKDAAEKSLLVIAREIGEIAERTRAGKATADELSGSTITISNVGSIGGLFATPIINHPEVAILGVNKLQKRAVVMPDGSIQARDMMYLGLSFDHRVTDGAEAVKFLNAIIGYLQDPELLLLEM